MAIQHAQQHIATFYDYSAKNWSTPESRYARKYLDFLTGQRATEPKCDLPNAEGEQIRSRMRRELRR